MDQSILDDLDKTYADWEEAERRHAHFKCIHTLIDSLPQDATAERAYQLKRLQYSPAYFEGSMFYSGERIGQLRGSAKDTIWGAAVMAWLWSYEYA